MRRFTVGLSCGVSLFGTWAGPVSTALSAEGRDTTLSDPTTSTPATFAKRRRLRAPATEMPTAPDCAMALRWVTT